MTAVGSSFDSALFAFGQVRLVVEEATQVAEARRIAVGQARRAGLDEQGAGRLALLVTEASTNLVKHGGGGELLVRALGGDTQPGIEVIALDRGRGIVDLPASQRDGYSTSGSPGTGLGAMGRLADEFDMHSTPGRGTVLRAAVWSAGRPPATIDIGAITVPKAGEQLCGDAWGCTTWSAGALLLVADGLGHGPEAHAAARAAVETLQRHPGVGAEAVLRFAHDALRPTRGAAVAVGEISAGLGTLTFAGLGNIAATLIAPTGVRHLVSHAGIAGHQARKIHAFGHEWSGGSLLVMHSDGLATRWDIADYPGLAAHHPALVAAVLYRDFCRGTDDVAVVAARGTKG